MRKENMEQPKKESPENVQSPETNEYEGNSSG